MQNKSGKENELKENNLTLEELIKLLLVLQLSDKLEKKNNQQGIKDCKEVKDILYSISEKIENLKENCSFNINTEQLKDLLIELRTLKGNLEGQLIQTLQDILDNHKKDLMILVEERSNLVLNDLGEILKDNYTNLVKLINELHGSLAIKLLVAMIIFLTGVVVGSWIERFMLHNVIDNIQTELKIPPDTGNSTLKKH
jgi:hypothetical protein